MKKLVYLLPFFFCASSIDAKDFGKGFAWGAFAGASANMFFNEMHRYQQPCRPSLYIVHPPKPQPNVYVVPQPASQPVICCQPQAQQLNYTSRDYSTKNDLKCQECETEAKQLELQIIKEQNRKKELALREKELDIQILKLKQV